MYIDEQIKIEINGMNQFISIRAERENLPILLYLHGGPGDAALPLVLKYNKALEKSFTVVVWEQRGAGKSYYKFSGENAINIDVFINDLYELTQYLFVRFAQKSLYLVGHSWGSVLGLRFAKNYPELVKTYIGCGQVVNMKKSCKIAYDFAANHADKKTLKRLKNIDYSYIQEDWLKDLLFVTKQVVKNKGSLYGQTNYNNLVKPFLFSKQYSFCDLINRFKGSMQSIKYLWQELMLTDFEEETRYDVPIVFIEGRYDKHVSSDLAKNYFDKIETEKQFYLFENSAHFPQWSEYERFNKLLCAIADRYEN